MTRFDILAILATQSGPISCARIAELTQIRGWYRRSFRADLATRLRRLRKWGLLKRWQARESTLQGGTLEVPVVNHPTWAGTALLGFSQRSASTRAKRIRRSWIENFRNPGKVVSAIGM